MDPAHIRALCDQIHDALAISEHPPAPKGGQGGASASRPPMPTAILDAKLDLKQKLTSWAQLIGEEHEVIIDCDDNTYSIAAWIYTKADWLAQHPAAGDFANEIDECVKALRRPYSSKDERRLVHITTDGAPIYAWPWEKTITLPDGTVERTHTLREALKGRTMDETLAAPNVSAVLREIFDMDVPADTIRKAAKRGTLNRHPGGFNVEEVVQRFATRTTVVAS